MSEFLFAVHYPEIIQENGDRIWGSHLMSSWEAVRQCVASGNWDLNRLQVTKYTQEGKELFTDLYRHLDFCQQVQEEVDQFEPMRNGVGFEHQLEARAFLLAEKKLMPTVIDEHLYYSPPTREVGVPLHHCFGGESTWMRRSIDRKGWFVDVNTDKKDFLYYVPARTQFPQGEIIYLVEGVFDALSLSPFASAISLLGTTLYEAQAACLKKKVELNGGLPVFVWMDPDKAGQKASTQILFQLKYELGIEAKVLMQNNEPNDLSPDVLHQIVVSGIKSYLPTTNHTYDPMRRVRN